MENNNKEKQEIIIQPELLETKAMLTDQYVEAAGKQIELRSKLLMTALKSLKPHDFQDFDGKPYLEGEGAARIMAVVRGFKVGVPTFKIENIPPHYFIECEIPMEWVGQSTVALGDCSTADAFFVGKDGNAGVYKKHLDRTGSETMAARIVLGDAKKKARENAISRGVTELLGIKGLTWNDLEKLGFLRTEAGATVQFKQGGSGGEIKTLTVSEAIKVKSGSKINIQATLIDWEVKQVGKDKKDITSYVLHDGTNKMTVKRWGGFHEGLEINKSIFCADVEVAEFQGSNQYLAKSIEPIEGEVKNA